MTHSGYIFLAFAFLLSSCVRSTSDSIAEDINPHYRHIDDYTLDAQMHLVKDIPASFNEKLVNVVIEIPTGTIDKWEVNKDSGDLEWEIKSGVPRVIDYLGYPGNYGFIPQTVLAKEDGGDGDPLDVLVLGLPVERGSIVQAEIIGVLTLLDRGEQDDKLIAVAENTTFSNIQSLTEMEKKYPGVIDVVSTWFANYKGDGLIQITGTAEKAEALKILEQAKASFTKQ
ncbi:MAG: inorganic pyrophosphatase [Flavobacteriales bacterium]|jgi:inorganic pyrophosphatase